MRFNLIAVIGQVCEAVSEMNAVYRDGRRDCAMQVAAMQRVVWSVESRLNRFPEWGTDQKAAVVPATLVEGLRPDAALGELFGDPEAMENARRIGADINAGADLAERPRLLIDVHIKSGAQQRRRRSQAANTAANDRNRSRTPADHDRLHPVPRAPAPEVAAFVAHELRQHHLVHLIGAVDQSGGASRAINPLGDRVLGIAA